MPKREAPASLTPWSQALETDERAWDAVMRGLLLLPTLLLPPPPLFPTSMKLDKRDRLPSWRVKLRLATLPLESRWSSSAPSASRALPLLAGLFPPRTSTLDLWRGIILGLGLSASSLSGATAPVAEEEDEEEEEDEPLRRCADKEAALEVDRREPRESNSAAAMAAPDRLRIDDTVT